MKTLSKLLEYVENNKNIYNIESVSAVKNFISNDELIKTGYIENGKVYGYPFLSSIIDAPKDLFNITDEIEYLIFIESVENNKDFFEIKGFSFFNELSITSYCSIEYEVFDDKNKSIDCEFELVKRTDLLRLSNGINFYDNAGFIIRMKKSCLNIGNYNLKININGVKKKSYFFSIDKESNLIIDYNYTNLTDETVSYFIKFKIFDKNKIKFINLKTSKYMNCPKIDIKAKVQKNKIKRFDKIQPFDKVLDFTTLYSDTYHVKFKIVINQIEKDIKYYNIDSVDDNLTYNPDQPGNRFYVTKDGTISIKISKNKIFFSDKINGQLQNLKKLIYKVKLHGLKVAFETLYNKQKRIYTFSNTPVDEVKDKIEQFEKDSNLLNLNIFGIDVWQIGRFFQYNNIYNETGVLQNIFAGKKKLEEKSKFSSITPAYKTFSYESSPFFVKPSTKNEFIIDNLRKIEYKDNFIDPNSKGYIDKLNKKNIPYVVCEDDYLYKHFIPYSKNRKYLDSFKRFSEVFSPMNKFEIVFSNKSVENIKNLSKIYNNIFNLRKTYDNNIKFWIKRYIYSYTYYFHVFHHIKPKIATIVGPYRPWIFAAAKKLNIYTKELQYAAIESHHPAYNFEMNNLYLPDEITLWGSFWCEELTKRPYKFTFMSNEFALENIKAISEINGNNKIYKYDYLYLSQGTIGNYMVKLALKHKENFPDDKILYRLHPHETIDLYPNLKKAVRNKLISVISLKEETLYSSLNNSNNILGVYSTSLIEAYVAGKKVGILNLPGLFYMDTFIKKYEIPVLEDENKFELFIKKIKEYKLDKDKEILFNGI